MTLEDIKNKFEVCLKKSDIHAFEFTTDEDYDTNLYIDDQGQFYLEGTKTPYVCEDFESIKYHIDEDETEQWYIVIYFKNGDRLFLHVYGDTYARIRRGTSAWCLENMELLTAYKYIVRSKETSQPMLIEENSVKYFDNSSAVVTIPNGIKAVDEDAFCYCSSVEEVHFPSSLEEIHKFAFANCKNLTEVVLNDSLRVIGNRAFVGCDKLNKVIIPDSVEKIEDYAFLHTAIDKVVINNSNIILGIDVFPKDCEIVYNTWFVGTIIDNMDE